VNDRSIAAWEGMQNAQDPMGAYARMYRVCVVAQSDDSDQVDVRLDDASLLDMARVPLRHGIPGLRVHVENGSYLLVGWDNGRPDKAFAALWDPDVHVTKVSFVADEIHVGSRTAHEAYVEGTSYRAAEDAMLSGLQVAFAALAAACTGPLGPLQPGMQSALLAIQQFVSSAGATNGFLSTKVFGE